MEWAALIAWLATAGGGFIMLAIWLRNGGMQQSRAQGNRIRPPVLFTHFLLAATGLVIWIVYVANDSDTLKWVAFALLVVVALIGFAMLGIWMSQRRTPAHTERAADGVPAEQHFPTAIVGLHGIAAATTLVLVFLTAVGVGD
jgi:hypothetical protein